jgi:hypothetical protein
VESLPAEEFDKVVRFLELAIAAGCHFLVLFWLRVLSAGRDAPPEF